MIKGSYLQTYSKAPLSEKLKKVLLKVYILKIAVEFLCFFLIVTGFAHGSN